MAHTSGYDFDVFISYAHVDNDPIDPAKVGWVSVFIQNLSRYLAKQLGRREAFSNFYDQQNLQGNHPIKDIPGLAKRSALFLAVLSPGYTASEFCMRELDAFIEHHGSDLAERLFVIEHMPLGEERHAPDQFRNVRKYRFYKFDENHIPRTFALPQPLPDEREYFQKIDDVAREIAGKLKAIGSGKSTQQPAVFLADVTDDMDSRRAEVQRYLDQAGIDVLPASAYRLMREEFETSLNIDLAKSAVFVQLLGALTGKRPPDVPNGFSWLQLESAKRGNMPILQWRSPDLDLTKVESDMHRKLLELETVRAMPIEDFKRSIVEVFNGVIKPAPVPLPPPTKDATDNPSMVFINADSVDKASADTIRDYLSDRFGWSMPLSLYEQGATPEELQQDMEENLLNSEGLFIVYGAVRPVWVTSQLQLYRKLAPRRKKNLRLLAVVEIPPDPKPPIPIGLPGLMRIKLDRVPEVVKSVLTS